MKIKLILFDAADTLLEKPDLYPALHGCLQAAGFKGSQRDVIVAHRNLREEFEIPDKTGWSFYSSFNKALADRLGMGSHAELPKKIYEACRGLEWKAADLNGFRHFNFRMGVLSNWDLSLKTKLQDLLPQMHFDPILVSAELGLRKPDLNFYHAAIQRCAVEPQEILYVGDSPKLDLHPASRTGMRAVLLDRYDLWPKSPFERIAHLAEVNPGPK